MDRYIYDELANLPLQSSLTRAFVKMVRKLTPEPDLPYLLDTDVEAAHARKPEYPIDFMHKCRAAYFNLAQILGTLVIIPALPLNEAKDAVVTVCDKAILARELGVSLEQLGIERKIGAPAAYRSELEGACSFPRSRLGLNYHHATLTLSSQTVMFPPDPLRSA